MVSAALEREMRRRAAQADVDLLCRVGASDNLDVLVEWSAARFEGVADLDA